MVKSKDTGTILLITWFNGEREVIEYYHSFSLFDLANSVFTTSGILLQLPLLAFRVYSYFQRFLKGNLKKEDPIKEKMSLMNDYD